MDGETLEAALPAARLDADSPVADVDVQIMRDGAAVVADREERAAHVIEEHTPRPRLVQEEHHPRGLATYIWNRGKFLKPDLDDALGRGYRRRKRIGGPLGEHGNRHERRNQQHSRNRHGRSYTATIPGTPAPRSHPGQWA